MGRCPRHTGTEGSYSSVHLRPVLRLEDRVDNSIEFRLDVTIPEPKDTITGRSQETVSLIVVFGAFEMLTPIQLDDETPVERSEVADVEADLVLAAELETGDLAATKAAPEKAFWRCLVVAESTRMAEHVRIGRYDIGDNMSNAAT